MTNAALLGSFGDASLSPMIFRNKIINGDMAVFQRNAAATTDGAFCVDRWMYMKSNGATSNLNQNSDAPSGVGFQYSLRETITTGDASIGSTEYSGFLQPIEGYLVRDLNFGTSSAKSITIQFWIRSSVTGQYTGNISNSNNTRTCTFNFTINVANTWEFKTVTLPGCTDGTWNTTTSVGMYFRIFSSIGSSFLGGTAGVWNTTNIQGSGTPVNGVSSNGNIIAITGVQIETGLAPTPFEFLPLQTQLNLCQRYYLGLYGASGRTVIFGQGLNEGATIGSCSFGFFPTPMRSDPTATIGAGLLLYGTTAPGTTNSYGSVSIINQRSSTSQGSIYFGFTGAYVGGSFVAYTITTGLQVAFSAEF